jgi:hypothetical protein
MILCSKYNVVSSDRLTDEMKRALKEVFVTLNLPGGLRKITKKNSFKIASVLAKILT